MSKYERKLEDANKADQHEVHAQKESSFQPQSKLQQANQQTPQQQVQPHQKVQQDKPAVPEQSTKDSVQQDSQKNISKSSESKQCPAMSGGECPGVKDQGACQDASCAANGPLLNHECPLVNAKHMSEFVLTQLKHALACHGVGQNCIDAMKKAERVYTRLTMIEREILYPEMQRLAKEEREDLDDYSGIMFAVDAFQLEHTLMDNMFKLCGQHCDDAKLVHSQEFKHFILTLVEFFRHHCFQEHAIWEKLNPMNHTDIEHGNEMNQRMREIFFSVPEDKAFSGAPSGMSGMGRAFDKVVRFFSGGSKSSSSDKSADQSKQDSDMSSDQSKQDSSKSADQSKQAQINPQGPGAKQPSDKHEASTASQKAASITADQQKTKNQNVQPNELKQAQK